MSFGFGVGDVILTSQLAYKLYSTVTTGRSSGPKHLQELADVLFGLRCALDHLSKVAKDITATNVERQDVNSTEIQRKLGVMVDSCGGTLQELDSVLTKYKTTIGLPDQTSADSPERSAPAVGKPGASRTTGSMARLRGNVRVNWSKVRWDVERDSLMEYRTKLQSHTDAINIILNTFLWSTTHRIQVEGDLNADKMRELQHQALQSNAALQQLVQDIHRSLVISERPPSASTTLASESSPKSEDFANLHVVSGTPPFGNLSSSVRPHIGPMASMATERQTGVTNGTLPAHIPLRNRQRPNEIGPSLSSYPAHRKRELPAGLLQLNVKRQSIGSDTFMKHQDKYFQTKPVSKPSFLAARGPSIPQLCDGVISILHTTSPVVPGLAKLDWTAREDIVRWTHALDNFLTNWTIEVAHGSLDVKNAKKGRQNDIVDLLVVLNESIDRTNRQTKRMFYQGTDQAGIDGVLDRLQAVSKSVRARKEIEEFKDARQEWIAGRNDG